MANPLIGSFGVLGTDDGARKTVVSITRSGRVAAYGLEAPACSPGSWPRFHHDNANSGDFSRDAAAPGTPAGLAVRGRRPGRRLFFRAPGDDLLCGTAARYEVVTADEEITPQGFDDARPLAGAPEPAEAGAVRSLRLPEDVGRFVAVRAVDEQGNVGRPAAIRVP